MFCYVVVVVVVFSAVIVYALLFPSIPPNHKFSSSNWVFSHAQIGNDDDICVVKENSYYNILIVHTFFNRIKYT